VPIFFYSKAHFDNFMKTNLHVVNDIYRNKTDTLERRHETVCLFYLFDIFVQFPILLFLIKPMLKLPLKNLYYIIFCIWGGYSSHYKLYPTGWKGVMNGFRRYWKLLSMGMCPVIPLCEEHNVKP
ncbi:MAG: hypothetical protein KKH94_13005, partial [Candidatus Omnitrophica bacterium]|nr:hypothetical protein [Candidatus Omnitrophota bacterium]